jgi:hypothetical protein
MAILRKNDPLYFHNIGRVYPRVKYLVVFSPLEKMLFNTVLVTSALYFIYFKLRLGWNSELDKFLSVKLAFDRTILQGCHFGNRLEHAATRNMSVEKVSSYPLANFNFSFVINTRSPNLNLTPPWGILAQILHSLQYRVNVWGVKFVWTHTYSGMVRSVVTC